MAEGSDISIDIVLKEQVKPALDALSAGIAEFTRTLSVLTAQAKSAGDAVGKTGEKTEKVTAAAATAKKETSELAAALEKEAAKAKDAAASMERFGIVVDKDSPRLRANQREVEALVSSYTRFRQAVANAITTTENKVRGLRSAKEALKDFRENLNGAASSLLSFKNLAIAAVAVLGAFKAKQFLENVVKDAAQLDETIRKAAAAIGQLDNATTERLREDLKRLSIQEGASIRELANAAIGVIPDVGERGLADFLQVAQRFSEVAGGNVGQIADTLIFTLKGFGIEAKDANESIADLASAISDKLFVAAREGNIAIGQLTGIIGLAAQQAEVLGISFDELLAAFTALGDVGVKPVRAFRVLSGVLNGVQEPSFKVKESIDRVNQTIPNLNLNFSRAGLAADGLGKFLSKLTIALKADDDLAKELGLNTRELGLIFKATANDGQAFSDALQQITNSRGEVDRAAEFILEGTEGKLRRIQAVFAALKDDIAQVFIPALDEFLGNFLDGVKGFRDAFGGSLSEIRQAADLVARNPNIGDTQKQAAIQSLAELQRQVNRAGIAVLAEALFTALKTGGEVIGKLLLAALVRGGTILKDLLLSALGKESASVEARNITTAQRAVDRLGIRGNAVVPTDILNADQVGELFVTLNRVLAEARSLQLMAEGRSSLGAANEAQREVADSEVVRQIASLVQTNENIRDIAKNDSERFLRIVDTVFRNNIRLQEAISSATGFLSAPRDEGLGGIFDARKALNTFILESLPRTFTNQQFVRTREGGAVSVNENANDAVRRAVVEFARQLATGEVSDAQARSTRAIISSTGVGGLTRNELDNRVRERTNAAAEENAVFDLTIRELERNIADLVQGLGRVIGALGRAQEIADPVERRNALLDVQGLAQDTNLTPVISALIELEDTSERVQGKIKEIGTAYGFVVEKNADGVLQVRSAAQQAGNALTSSTAQATNALSQLVETSQKVGTATSRLNTEVATELEGLAQRFANVEIARLRSAGTTQDNALADQIAESIAKVEELKKEIGKFEAADKALDDAALARVKELKEQLRTQTEIVFSFVPNAKPLFDNIQQINERIAKLRAEAALITLGAAGATGLQSLGTNENAERVNAALLAEQRNQAQAYADLIQQGIAVQGEEAQKAVREAIKKQGADAEKLVIGIAKQAGRLQVEALRTVARDEAGAKLVEQTIKDLDRLVTERQEAFGENLTTEVDRLNEEIAEKITELVDSVAGTAPQEIRDAYLSIVDTLNQAQTSTGAAARALLDNAAASLNALIQRLIGVSQGIAADLARNELAVLRAEQAFKSRQQQVGLTRAVAEPVQGRLELGGFESQFAARQISAISSALTQLESQLERVRNLPLTVGDEVGRQREIDAINALIDRYRLLLEAKLKEQGANLDANQTLSAYTVQREELERLIALEQQRVPVLEEIRKVTEESNNAARTYANTQKLAATNSKAAYAEVEAVYGRAIFQIDGTASATQRGVQATKAYIAVLDSLLAKLLALAEANPELAGDIQPQVDDLKNKIVDLKATLPAEGNAIGTAFVDGLKQGLGAASDIQEFAANLGRGIGGAIQGNLGAAIDSVIDGTKSLGEAFRDFVSDTLIDIGKLIVKMLILQAIQSALGFPLFGLNQGGEVPSPVELNRGGMVPHPYQPRKWSGYNDGGMVAEDKPSPRGIMGRIRAAVARIKPPKPQPAPQPIFVRAFAQGGAVTADPLVRAISTIVNVLTPQQQPQMRFFNTGGFVARDANKTPRIDRVLNTISRVFDPDDIQALNTGGQVQESGVSKAIKALTDILKPPEPQVLALAGGGIAYLEVGGFPSNAPRRQGRVPGPNVNKDVVPAMLTPGEFVMKRSAVQRYGLGVMYAMNEGIVPRDMFGSLPNVRKLATGGTAAEADIPSRIEVNVPQQGGMAAPASAPAPSQPVPAYIVANEQAMQNLLNGGKNAMLDFMRRNRNA